MSNGLHIWIHESSLRKKIKNVLRGTRIQPLNNARDNFKADERQFQQALSRENIALNVLERPNGNIVTNVAQ